MGLGGASQVPQLWEDGWAGDHEVLAVPGLALFFLQGDRPRQGKAPGPAPVLLRALWREGGSVPVFLAFPSPGLWRLPCWRRGFDEGLSPGGWGS